MPGGTRAHGHDNATRLALLEADQQLFCPSTELIAPTAFRLKFGSTCCN
jgi:hypothetical protein